MGDGTYGGLNSSRSMLPVRRGSKASTRSVSTTCASVRVTLERGQQAATSCLCHHAVLRQRRTSRRSGTWIYVRGEARRRALRRGRKPEGSSWAVAREKACLKQQSRRGHHIAGAAANFQANPGTSLQQPAASGADGGGTGTARRTVCSSGRSATSASTSANESCATQTSRLSAVSTLVQITCGPARLRRLVHGVVEASEPHVGNPRRLSTPHATRPALCWLGRHTASKTDSDGTPVQRCATQKRDGATK